MKKVLSLVLSLVMLLGLVVPVSAEDTIFEGNGTLKDKTVAFTIEADKTTLYGEGEQIVKFHIYAESVDNVPIRAFQFTLVPSANLTLATELAADNAGFNYAHQNTGKLINSPSNMDGMYRRFEYTPGSRYFGAAGTDEGKGITTKTEVMTIMGKVNGVDDYTLSMTGVVAGNGDAPNKVTQRFTCTAAGTTVTVKPGSARPQPNLSLALSADKVKVGDTFTATLSNKKMSIISFISQIRFNKDVLEVVSITESEGYTNLASGAKTAVITTVADANDRGVVGISVAKTEETTYPVKDIVTVTFKAKAAGEGWFKVDESTDGKDGTNGYLSDAIVKSVVIEKPAYVLGDVNEDGKVNMTDVNRLFRYTTRKEISLTEAQLAAADVTGDGKVNITDVNRLFKFVTKQITTL
ncbi:MAG: dockerin type I domain-containing protein [Oscillospiraceae bacterium]